MLKTAPCLPYKPHTTKVAISIIQTDSPWQDLPAWQWVMWLSTFFMVRQWGRLHCRTSPLACSLRWHLCAWSKSTSCCWISFRFSGSAVGGAAPGPVPTAPSPTGAPPTAAPTGTLPTVAGCCWDAWGRKTTKWRGWFSYTSSVCKFNWRENIHHGLWTAQLTQLSN